MPFACIMNEPASPIVKNKSIRISKRPLFLVIGGTKMGKEIYKEQITKIETDNLPTTAKLKFKYTHTYYKCWALHMFDDVSTSTSIYMDVILS